MQDKELHVAVALSGQSALDMLKGALKYLGISKVTTIRDPKNILSVLSGQEVDIMIGDYSVLRGKNTDMLNKIRAVKLLNSVKIILLASAEIKTNELKELYREGISSVLMIPYKVSELEKCIKDAMRSVSSQAADAFTKIRQLDFFSFMNNDEMMKLLKVCKCRKYNTGDTIFEEGEQGDRFYVIIEGSLTIGKCIGEGVCEALAKLEKGACFGEMAILEQTTRSARATADEEILLFELDSKIMDGYDDIITLKLFKKLAYVFSDRLRHADAKIKELAQYNYSKD